MSKRVGDNNAEDMEIVSNIKKLKSAKDETREDNNMIDSELLGHQTNFQGGTEQEQAQKAIEDLNKLRSESSNSFDYGSILKSQGAQAIQAQAQREAQVQAMQAQAAQAHFDAVTQNDQGLGPGRPISGSDEWRKLRKDNHKEVERRRREHINAGIKALSALLPTNETNKAQILQRAVEYIKRLKENEANNIEKWTLEKLLTDQAVAELNLTNDKLKQELEKTYKELEHYKKMYKEEKK